MRVGLGGGGDIRRKHIGCLPKSKFTKGTMPFVEEETIPPHREELTSHYEDTLIRKVSDDGDGDEDGDDRRCIFLFPRAGGAHVAAHAESEIWYMM